MRLSRLPCGRGIGRLSLLVLMLALVGCGSGEDAATTKTTADAPDAGAVVTPPGPDPQQPAEPAPPPVDPKTVVVRVNGEEITVGDIDAELTVKFSFQGPIPPNRMPMLRKQFGAGVESQLIDRKLIEQAIAAAKLVPTKESVEERWKLIQKMVGPSMTIEQHLERSGLTREEADKKIRESLVLEQLFEPKAEGERPEEPQAKEFYEENAQMFKQPERVRARHILLKTEPGFDDAKKAELKKRLEGFREELAKEGGPAFEDLAKQHSEGPSGPNGGDLGEFGRGRMVPAFEKVAFALKPGEVSEIVETEFGFHIIKCEEKHEASTRPYEEVKDQILAHLRGKRLQKARTAYLEELRGTAEIERIPLEK